VVWGLVWELWFGAIVLELRFRAVVFELWFGTVVWELWFKAVAWELRFRAVVWELWFRAVVWELRFRAVVWELWFGRLLINRAKRLLASSHLCVRPPTPMYQRGSDWTNFLEVSYWGLSR